MGTRALLRSGLLALLALTATLRAGKVAAAEAYQPPMAGRNSASGLEAKVVWATKAATRVSIDGRLDEACWNATDWATGFFAFPSVDRLADPQTHFAAVYDKSAVYFGIRCPEPAPDKMVAKRVGHDGSVWAQDAIELFLSPGRTRSNYYQFAANTLGSQYEGEKSNGRWDGPWQVGVQSVEGGWTMEIAVPFKTLGLSVPAPGAAWAMNIVRDRRGMQLSSSWGPVGGRFHNPGKFGTVLFGSFDTWWETGYKALWRARIAALRRNLDAASFGKTRLLTELDTLEKAARDKEVRHRPARVVRREGRLRVYQEAGRLVERLGDMADKVAMAVALSPATRQPAPREAAQRPNLIQDGGFENVSERIIATDRHVYAAIRGGADFGQRGPIAVLPAHFAQICGGLKKLVVVEGTPGKEVHSGKRAILLHNSYYLRFKRMTAKTGDLLVSRFYAKGKGTAFLVLDGKDSKGNHIQVAPPGAQRRPIDSDDWTLIEHTMDTSHPNLAEIVGVRMYTTAEMYLDDLSLVKGQ